jgi:hypothetical protein
MMKLPVPAPDETAMVAAVNDWIAVVEAVAWREATAREDKR